MIGFVVFNDPVTVELGINGEPPNNIVATQLNVPQVIQFYGANVQIWGVPAAPSHDPLRGRCLAHNLVEGKPASQGICHTGNAEVPFLTLPRSCTGPLTSSYEALSWQEADAPPDRGSFQAPAMTDCSALGLSSEVHVQPSTSSAESPSGLDFSLDFNDEGFASPTGRAQSDLKKAVVTLPAGMTVNPSSAAGLAACTKVQYEAESLRLPAWRRVSAGF